MKRELCVLFLVCLAAVVVQSKTSIEYDENGDEIEVKRFYIEGRQVNGGRRQCVETRRKRQASYNGINQENANEESIGKKKTEDFELSPTTPATGIDTATSEDESPNKSDNHRIGLIGVMDDRNHHIGIDEEDDDVEDLEDTFHGTPVLAHKQRKQHKQHSSSSQSATAAIAGPNGIVVVHTHSPPKVNPQTHAVFQLMPAQASSLLGTNEYDDDDIDNSQLLYEEEISPVSTTAIWSTGADDDLDDIDDHIPGDDNDYGGEDDGVDDGIDDGIDDGGDDGGDYAGDIGGADDGDDSDDGDNGDDGDDDFEDDYDLDAVQHIATKKPKEKPAKGSSRPVKNGGGNKKKKQSQKKKRPSTHKRRRPGNKNKRLPGKRGMGGSNTRRRPSNNKQRRHPVEQQEFTNRIKADKNNNHNQGFRKKGNRRVNANLANRDIKRKNTNKLDAVNQGTNTFSKTETLTQTGTANDEKDVNCIIINKETPTTQRPFWAILGRDANGKGNGDASAGRHFGKRKRINLRLAA